MSANLLADLSSSASNFFTKKSRESVLNYTTKKIMPTVIAATVVVLLILCLVYNNKKEKCKKMVVIIEDTRKDLDLQEFRDTLKKFAEVQKNVNTMVTLNPDIPVMVVVNIHSDQAALKRVITEFLKKKQKGEKVQLLFMGGYSDSGNQGPYEEGSAPDAKVWYLLMKLKMLYKDEVFLLRGNNETKKIGLQHKSFERMLDYFRSKGHKEEELEDLSQEVNDNFFESLSVAATHGDSIFMYGGLPAVVVDYSIFKGCGLPLVVCVKNQKEMFEELAKSKDKNLPFKEEFNAKYLYIIVNEEISNRENLFCGIRELLKREVLEVDNKEEIKNKKAELLKQIEEKELLFKNSNNEEEKEKILEEVIDLTNRFYKENLFEYATFSLAGDKISLKRRVFECPEYNIVGFQLLWNEFNKEDKQNSRTECGVGFYYNEGDIKELNEKCGYKRVINGNNHDGLYITEVTDNGECQQIVTMGSPNMNCAGNPGNIFIIDKKGKTEDKYDNYRKDEKFEEKGFKIKSGDYGGAFKKDDFISIFEFNEED